MAGFFKKLFGGGAEDDLLRGMIERSEKWRLMGVSIAQDCYENGLCKGEIVRLSEITNFIEQNHSCNGKAVEGGFLDGMKSYLDKELVVSFNVEGGDIVFVHNDHVNDVIGRK